MAKHHKTYTDPAYGSKLHALKVSAILPKNWGTFPAQTRERARLYLRRRTLLQKENHLASLGGWKKHHQNMLFRLSNSLLYLGCFKYKIVKTEFDLPKTRVTKNLLSSAKILPELDLKSTLSYYIVPQHW